MEEAESERLGLFSRGGGYRDVVVVIFCLAVSVLHNLYY
jgi:hypothetical protein